MKHQVLFSLKNNEKIFMNVVCCSCDWRFKGKSYMYNHKFTSGVWVHFHKKQIFILFSPLPAHSKGSTLILSLTLMHSERPKLYTILAFVSAIRLKTRSIFKDFVAQDPTATRIPQKVVSLLSMYCQITELNQ